MAEYIERDKIFSVWRSIPSPASVASLSAAIHQTPVIEIVRCKECQSHEPCEVRNRVWCRTMGRYMKEDGFCSEGVKIDA